MTIAPQEVALRLFLASLLGALIGYQRETAERPAGLRTHSLVCLGSSLIMIISIYPFINFRQVDVSRIAAQVVVGIGFLGAGTIIRQGNIVLGLTTAASLWAIAAVGLAIGCGAYWAGFLGTLFILIILTLFKKFEEYYIKKARLILMVRLEDKPGQLGMIDSLLGKFKIVTRGVEIEHLDGGEVIYRLGLELPSAAKREKVLEKVASLSGVYEARWTQ